MKFLSRSFVLSLCLGLFVAVPHAEASDPLTHQDILPLAKAASGGAAWDAVRTIHSKVRVETGGMTSGSKTIVSRTLLKGHSLRANNHASAIPKGKISAVLASPTAREKRVICQDSKEKITRGRLPRDQSNTTKPYFLKASFAAGV